MTKPFEPVREDGRPYWQVIYDEIVARMENGQLRVDDVIAHDQIIEWLDGVTDHYGPVSKAAQRLREYHKRSLTPVRGVGYKLVAGIEHVRQAKDQHHSSKRSLSRAVEVISTVDHSVLSPEESSRVTEEGRGLAVLAGVMKLTLVKVAEHEEEIEILKQAKMESSARHRAAEEDMAEIRDRLEALEQSRN